MINQLLYPIMEKKYFNSLSLYFTEIMPQTIYMANLLEAVEGNRIKVIVQCWVVTLNCCITLLLNLSCGPLLYPWRGKRNTVYSIYALQQTSLHIKAILAFTHVYFAMCHFLNFVAEKYRLNLALCNASLKFSFSAPQRTHCTAPFRSSFWCLQFGLQAYF